MAIAVALWSAVLAPGEPVQINPPSDIRITNAALSDELADATGRTTVKLTYTIPKSRDSDDEDEDDDEDELTASTTVLCSLTAGKIEQTMVDLVLEADEIYQFEVVGKNTVHLVGNYIDQMPPDQVPFNDESDDEDVEGAYDLRDVSSDVEAVMESDDERFEEVVEEAPKKDTTKKRPRESDAMDTEGGEAFSKTQKKKLSKKLKAEGGKAIATGTEESPAAAAKAPKEGEAKKDKKEKKKKATEGGQEKTQEKELPGGLKIFDAKIGTGRQAKKGDTVSMRYVGKLLNGKTFDSNTKGKPFKFRLGQGEVIKGWDLGVAGMHVGSERVLEVPAALAYGKKKMTDIPANSTLKFEVKLLSIE